MTEFKLYLKPHQSAPLIYVKIKQGFLIWHLVQQRNEMPNYKIEKLRDWEKNPRLISSDFLLSQAVKCFESDPKEQTNSEFVTMRFQ